MIKKTLIPIILFFIHFLVQGQNDACNIDCSEEKFKNIFFKTEVKHHTFLYIKNGELMCTVNYNSKNHIKKYDGKRVKYKEDSLLKVLGFNFEERNYQNILQKGFSIDTNIQYSLSQFDAPILIGIGKYINGKKEGKWFYYNQFTLEKYAIANYHLGNLNEEMIMFSKGKLIGRINFVNNCRHGNFTFYFDNGNISEFGENKCDEPYQFIHYKNNGTVLFIYDKNKDSKL